MAVATEGDVQVRLHEAARALGLTEHEVITRALDAYLPPRGVRSCGMCGGSGVVHTGGSTKSCPQCGGSGIY